MLQYAQPTEVVQVGWKATDADYYEMQTNNEIQIKLTKTEFDLQGWSDTGQ